MIEIVKELKEANCVTHVGETPNGFRKRNMEK